MVSTFPGYNKQKYDEWNFYIFLAFPIKFTIIQVGCFIVLWIIQSFKQTSILFPIMLLLLIGIQKLMEMLFSEHELKVLDDVLPDSTRRERLDQEEARRLSVDFSAVENEPTADNEGDREMIDRDTL